MTATSSFCGSTATTRARSKHRGAVVTYVRSDVEREVPRMEVARVETACAHPACAPDSYECSDVNPVSRVAD